MGVGEKDYSYRKRRGRVGLSRQHLAAQHAADPERVKRFEARMAALSNVRRRVNYEASTKRWCIIRTSPSATIALTDSLTVAGFDVWTPTEILQRRMGRARGRIDRLSPIMPSFIFASSEHATDLFRLSLNPVKRHDDFSVFHHRDRVPLISDRDMDMLRDAEQDAAERRIKQMRRDRHKAEPFQPGQEIKIAGGAFGGLPGVIEESDGRFTLVCFGTMRVKMDTFILRADIL